MTVETRRMYQREGTAAQWAATDTVLASGEIGFENDTGKFKIGDGTSEWSELPHFRADRSSLRPAGSIAETYQRSGAVNNSSALSTGRLSMVAIDLPTGPVTSISVWSATTAAGTPTNWWFALYDLARVLLRQTADQTTTAWAANTKKALALTTPYTVTAAGLYYVGIMVAAATVPTLRGSNTHASINGDPPIAAGTSTTGLTTTAPNPAAAITASAEYPYAYVT